MARTATVAVKISGVQSGPKPAPDETGLRGYFYHHRPDPNTPLEETMAALDLIVRQGKALYVGLSNYPAD